MVMDDPCTYVLNSLHRFGHSRVLGFDFYLFKFLLFRYPTTAELAYGSSRRGCFENPDDVKPPKEGLDCPDIIPLKYDERDEPPNSQAMQNPSQLVQFKSFYKYEADFFSHPNQIFASGSKFYYLTCILLSFTQTKPNP